MAEENKKVEPIKCELCDSITFHILDDHRAQCVQCGGMQKNIVIVPSSLLQGKSG